MEKDKLTEVIRFRTTNKEKEKAKKISKGNMSKLFRYIINNWERIIDKM